MEKIKYIFIIAIAICLVWLFFPQSCENKPSELQVKSDKSLKADSIQSEITKHINAKSDSMVKIYKDSISILRSKNEKLSSNYYALRAKIKHLTTVKVDSSGQTVNVPVIEYNASINSGTMCDSLLMYLDSELMLKDSIISVREIQVNSLIKKIETGEVANSDLLALVEELKQELKRCNNQNRALKILAILAALANLTH